jgi:hypothetical protein
MTNDFGVKVRVVRGKKQKLISVQDSALPDAG